MNPYTVGVVILVALLACAEASSLWRTYNVRRYEESCKRYQTEVAKR